MHHEEDNGVSNNSGNRPFEDVLEANLQRRRFLKNGVTAAVGAAVMGSTGFLQAFPGNGKAKGVGKGLGPGAGKPLLGFTPVSLAQGTGPEPAISPEYQYDVILPWGDPIVPGGTAFNEADLPLPPTQQAEAVGIGHDGMWFFPIRDAGKPRYGWDDDGLLNPWNGQSLGNGPVKNRGVLCMNNEFGTNFHVLRKSVPESLDDVRSSQHAHGVTVVELQRSPGKNGSWNVVASDLARRIHVNTPVDFSGPAAGHPDLMNNSLDEPRGTANNCAMGYTPWGTYLTCEENFNGYFGTEDPGWSPSAKQARYGISDGGFGYGWHLFDERFDLASADYANEHNRFGWVVEIDPMDPQAKPVKRTALGRKKNEGATCHVAEDGRVIVYNGDDERFDYIYKYVSAEPWQQMRANGESPLDRGTLYAARFNSDGSGEWLELSLANPAIAAEFADYGEMLINARRAADLAGATPMDRPEWATVAPDGQVYFALTNNSRRTVPGPANPLAPNADGHIVRWTETRGHSGDEFSWDIFVIAEDTHGTEESFADPDGIWCDPDGRLFIQTDGGQKDGLQNQMLVADTGTAEIRRLFTGVPGCEITGITVTPDRRTMFINVQHPGNGDPGSSSFPAPTGSGAIPRDATIVITRKDGGIIGS